MLWGLARLSLSGCFDYLPQHRHRTVDAAAEASSTSMTVFASKAGSPARGARNDRLVGLSDMPGNSSITLSATEIKRSGSSWVPRCAAALLQRYRPESLSPQQLSNIAWALQHLAPLMSRAPSLPVSGSDSGDGNGALRSDMTLLKSAGTSAEAVVADAAAHSVPSAWRPSSVAAAASRLMPSLSPPELCALLAAFARWGHDPGDAWWARCFAVTAGTASASLSARQVAALLWAIARLRGGGGAPPWLWLSRVLRRFDSVLPSASLQAVAMVSTPSTLCAPAPSRLMLYLVSTPHQRTVMQDGIFVLCCGGIVW